MNLSSAQTVAAMSGMERNPTWTPLALPTGPQELPKWLLGCHVDLMEAYASSPRVILKVDGDPFMGEPKIYENEGNGNWVARSSDGHVMSMHHHAGHVERAYAWRVVRGGKTVTQSNPDGWCVPTRKHNESWQQACWREASAHVELCKRYKGSDEGDAPYLVETSEPLVTERQDGYGGRHFHITLKNGDLLILRGPWHTCPPVGWNDCVMVDVSDPYYTRSMVVRGKELPWYARGGTFGLFFSDDLVKTAVARWAPHLLAATVYPGYGHAGIEFYPVDWGAPKQFAEERKPGWGPKAGS